MYEIGDYVICKSGGVWKITNTRPDSLILVEHEKDAEKIITIGNNELIRKIVLKESMLEVIERVPYIRTIQAPNDKIRKEFYEDAMAKYDEIEWIKIIKTIYLRKEKMKLMPNELFYAKAAKRYLHGEISVLLKMPMSKVEEYITSTVSNNTWLL